MSIVLVIAMLVSLLLGGTLVAGAADKPFEDLIEELIDVLADESVDKPDEETENAEQPTYIFQIRRVT